jgi:hypothetical protein
MVDDKRQIIRFVVGGLLYIYNAKIANKAKLAKLIY